MSRLTVEGLSVQFGGLRAVDDITFSAEHGEVFGIIGPNGAGKTTLLNAISRIVTTSRGEIHLDDQALHRVRAHRLARLGVARTFQAAETFNDLNLIDYMVLGRLGSQNTSAVAAALRVPSLRRDERKDLDAALGLLDEFGLAELGETYLRELPYGIRKLVDILRALLGEPRLLLLDEPTSGTAVEDRKTLQRALMLAKDRGVTTLLIDHDVQFVAALCSRVLVMNFGRELGIGEPHEVLSRSTVREAYTGLEA